MAAELESINRRIAERNSNMAGEFCDLHPLMYQNPTRSHIIQEKYWVPLRYIYSDPPRREA